MFTKLILSINSIITTKRLDSAAERRRTGFLSLEVFPGSCTESQCVFIHLHVCGLYSMRLCQYLLYLCISAPAMFCGAWLYTYTQVCTCTDLHCTSSTIHRESVGERAICVGPLPPLIKTSASVWHFDRSSLSPSEWTMPKLTLNMTLTWHTEGLQYFPPYFFLFHSFRLADSEQLLKEKK